MGNPTRFYVNDAEGGNDDGLFPNVDDPADDPEPNDETAEM